MPATMRPLLLAILALAVLGPAAAGHAAELPSDTIDTAEGPLRITFVGHGTLMLEWQDRVVHVDPWSKLADYAQLPDADLILITHAHRDHLDPEAIAAVRRPATTILTSLDAKGAIEGATVLPNGQSGQHQGIVVQAVPAYNLVHQRESGEPFHPKGEGNGYLITFGGTRVYVAGDTENVPEMGALGTVDVAFLPMNLPYTMTPEMTAAAARAVAPRILYPYHYGDTDPEELVRRLADSGIEVRVRPMR